MLITDAYRELNTRLHESNPNYGTSGHKWAKHIGSLAGALETNEILDYGCGKQTLANALPQFTVHGYDPAIEGLDEPPEPHDLVVCGDVLEHIEPECLDDVLDDLKRVTRGTLFLVVATRPASKTLADGRNAHLIVEPPAWWLPKLMEHFDLSSFHDLGGEFLAVMGVKE